MSPFHKGKFHNAGQAPGGGHSVGSKAPPKEESKPPADNKGAGKPPAAAGQEQSQASEHVTKTHPGMTQPHPTTGVHAVHQFHKGGGKFESHTHHDGGEVEPMQHDNAADMHAHSQQMMPDDGMGHDPNQMDLGMDEMSGLNPKQESGSGGGY